MWIPRSETWIEQVTGIPGEAAALRLLWHVGAAGGLERLFFEGRWRSSRALKTHGGMFRNVEQPHPLP